MWSSKIKPAEKESKHGGNFGLDKMILAEYFFCRVCRLVKCMGEPNKYDLTENMI
jgi:hypothetical protein